MPTSQPDPAAVLSFTREESWIVHAALLATLREADEAGRRVRAARDAIRAVEAGRERFTRREARAVQDSLISHLADAPLRDRPPGRSALRTVSSALD